MGADVCTAVGVVNGSKIRAISDPKINISVVEDLSLLERAWTQCYKYLSVAVDKAHGELTLEDAKSACQRGDMHLWLVYTSRPEFIGAAVTQVVEYPRFKAMRIVLLGGKMFDDWKGKLDAAISEAARGIGCKRMEAFGRTGFVRSLQGLGYDRLYTAIGKEL